MKNASERLKTVMTERSIYDLIADLWYFPVLPKYLKAIIGPFIIKRDPEETIKNFDQLGPKFKSFMLKKGLIHIFPEGL